jgi:hypothetical protein
MLIDRQLLTRILEHYKHRIDEFLQDEKIKPLASEHLTKHIARLRQDIDTALAALRPAVAQYQKDARQFLDEAHEKLSGPSLHELEIELARIAAEIATLLNL